MRTAPGIFSLIAVMMFITLHLPGQGQIRPVVPWEDEKFFSAGYTLGFNLSSFMVTPSEQHTLIDSLYPSAGALQPGVNIHLALNFRLNQFFDVRLLPGISFSQRNIDYLSTRVHHIALSPQKTESALIELPLQVRYGWRMQNTKPYIVGGVNYRYDFYAQKKYRIERPVYIRLNRPDLCYEAGAGVGFYLSGIKLSVEMKMSNGLLELHARDPHPEYPGYSNTVEKIRSRSWILSFHFE